MADEDYLTALPIHILSVSSYIRSGMSPLPTEKCHENKRRASQCKTSTSKESTYKESGFRLLQSPCRAEEYDTRSYDGNGEVDECCSHSGCREEGRRVILYQHLRTLMHPVWQRPRQAKAALALTRFRVPPGEPPTPPPPRPPPAPSSALPPSPGYQSRCRCNFRK
ncbi:unnamed protein product [Chrysodeixis includens]|uniref:Uncharacterized protein n=1 Tax=Chrysodeixis includens TaxID=689277 RepID=A0A9N8KR26_CHRIL|nr:unnamed protein product [Chrysodeixis includens]